MPRLLLFNKPYGVHCQFRPIPGARTLADFIGDPAVRVAGRLDKDSEGLLLLSADGRLVNRIANPRHKMWKRYWVEVEGEIAREQLEALRRGVLLNDGPTLPARVSTLDAPELWPRDPPVRFRKTVPTGWLQIAIREGRNRQIRRMTASVGLPTLRLVRVAVGPWRLAQLQPGEWLWIDVPPNTGIGSRCG